MVKIELKVSQTVEQNAAVYYERAKKYKKKLQGIKDTIARSEKELARMQKKADVERKQLEEEEAAKERLLEKKRNKKWYEKYRWFVSSDGFLIVGGRDATTNEVIIKKHTQEGDLVFHTDMAGSPFFIIQSEGKKIPESTIKEAADATCTFSRAWKLGLQSQQVFYVKPDQVSKTAQSGEYLTKGAFMIRGKTTYIDNEVNCACGVNEEEQFMCGPYEAVKKHCTKVIRVEQGEQKPSDAAKKLKKLIGGELDEIIRALPPGNVKVVAKG